MFCKWSEMLVKKNIYYKAETSDFEECERT